MLFAKQQTNTLEVTLRRDALLLKTAPPPVVSLKGIVLAQLKNVHLSTESVPLEVKDNAPPLGELHSENVHSEKVDE